MKKLLVYSFVQCFLLIVLFHGLVNAQNTNAPSGLDEFNHVLDYAWVGGMDAAQYNAVDLNLDGIMDLLVFDRRGNRKLCFINAGVANEISYSYAPSYAELLPPLFEWAKFVDYDQDGRMDIFTYSPGYSSMMVYRNISDDDLKFQRVVYPYLTSFQGGGYVNILVTNADYPGFVDLDDDGDIDILTFWGLGSFLEVHQNMSMEKYGVPDSLDFMQTTFCWGEFAESDESNALYLDTCLGSVSAPMDLIPYADRHSGSTLLFADLDGNGLKDLLLGDVDYPGLLSLYNDGTIEVAHIGRTDTLFPQNNEPIRLFSMPNASLIDVNNDGLEDLLVGVFDPGLQTSRNKKSSWLYLNKGTAEIPAYSFETKAFLQEEMIDRGSGAYPVLYDFDGDGLIDLFIGNFGYYAWSYYDNYTLKSVFYARIGYYKNVGTFQSPIFQLWDDDFGKLSQLHLTGLIPAFDDLDGDGDADVVVGKEDGRLLKLINNGNETFSLIDEQFSGIDVGFFSAPQLFDLNKDGLKDLIVGERDGNLNYYQNVGTPTAPQFEYVTDSLGKVNVTDYNLSYDGYSVPCFFIDNSGQSALISGSEQGQLMYYTQIDGNLEGKFILTQGLNALLDTSGVNFDRGMRTAAAIGSIRGNGSLQLFAGNYSGGLEFFNGNANVLSYIDAAKLTSRLTLSPNPAKNRVYIDGAEFNSVLPAIYAVSVQGKSYPLTAVSNSKNGIELDVSMLKQGLYLVVIQDIRTVRTAKLVVTF